MVERLRPGRQPARRARLLDLPLRRGAVRSASWPASRRDWLLPAPVEIAADGTIRPPAGRGWESSPTWTRSSATGWHERRTHRDPGLGARAPWRPGTRRAAAAAPAAPRRGAGAGRRRRRVPLRPAPRPGHLGDGRWPIVLGHEGAGVVEAVGESVTHVRPGDPVVFCFVPPCGACRMCTARRPHLCETAAEHSLAGMLMDGTSRLERPDGTQIKHFLHVSCFAERCVVPAGSAVPLGAELPLWQAALVGCGVVTGVGAVKRGQGRPRAIGVRDRLRRGRAAGCDGARLAGAGRIVAVDRDPAKLALARGPRRDRYGRGRRRRPRRDRRARARRLRPCDRGDRPRRHDPAGLGRPAAGGPGDGGRDRAGRRRGLAAGARPAEREDAARLLLRLGGRRRGAARPREGWLPPARSTSPEWSRTSPTWMGWRRRCSACAVARAPARS